MTKPTAHQIVELAMQQAGKPYIYGYEVHLDNPDPQAFDCSELVQWVCHRLGVRPEMPDGAIWQYKHCAAHHTIVPVKRAVDIEGALLFRVNYAGLGNHVAISRGNGGSIEARGKKYGVGSWPLKGRTFNYAALIPGVSYEAEEE